MGNKCFKGYKLGKSKGPTENNNESAKSQKVVTTEDDSSKQIAAVNSTNMRQLSTFSSASTATLSDEEVTSFFNPQDKYEIKWRRNSQKKHAPTKSVTSSHDITIDVGATNLAFTAEEIGEELNLNLATPQTKREQNNISSSDSGVSTEFERSYADTTDTTHLSTQASLGDDNKTYLAHSMSTEEILDLIDKLLLTDPGESSTDSPDNTNSTRETETKYHTGSPNNLEMRRGKLLRSENMEESVNEDFAEGLEMTLRNEVLIAENTLVPKHRPSRESTLRDEDELWTRVEMTEQNLLSRLSLSEVTSRSDILQALSDISEDRQAMLRARWNNDNTMTNNVSDSGSERINTKCLTTEDNEYSKKMETLNDETARNLLNSAHDYETLQRIMEEHKRRQLAYHAQLMAQKHRTDALLQKKLAIRNNPTGSQGHDSHNSSEKESGNKNGAGDKHNNKNTNVDNISDNSDLETYGVISNNGESDLENQDLDLDGRMSRYATYNSDDSASNKSEEELIITAYEDMLAYSDQEELHPLQVDQDLRLTLKTDVKMNLGRMSAVDFQELLTIYREEEHGCLSIVPTDNHNQSAKRQSLWKKMELQRSDIKQTVPEESQAAKRSLDIDTVNKAIQTLNKQYASKSTELDGDFVASVEKSTAMSQDELQQLLDRHLTMTEDERHQMQTKAELIQKKLQQKLEQDIVDVSEGGARIPRISNLHTEFNVHREQMHKADDAIEQLAEETRQTFRKKASSLSAEDVKQMLQEFRQQQKQLIQKRDVRRKLMNDKLNLILEERKRHRGITSNEESGDDPLPNSKRSKHKSMLDIDIEKMDADFYEELMEKYRKVYLTDEELDQLIEDHLDKVNQFKRRVKRALSKKRLERENKHEDRKRQTERQHAENMRDASRLVEEQQAQAVQMRRLRERERQRASMLLREKLKLKLNKVGEK